MDNKEKFIELLKATNRKGVDGVIDGLEELGFFTAPASSVFHLNTPCGLLQHSINVFEQAIAIRDAQIKIFPKIEKYLPIESVVIASLLHDVCKAEIYKQKQKFRKDENGRWEKYVGYEPEYSEMPLGHGEKSVIRLLRMGLELTDDEMFAIRWHMANWSMSDDRETKSSFSAAVDRCPLLSIVISADELATRISENNLIFSDKENV